MAVGVPGTGKVGLAIAAALGALIRDPALELSVLCNITPELLQQADRMIGENMVDITLNDHQGLYISAVVYGEKGNARAVIEGRHTNLVLLERDGKVVSHKVDHTNKKSIAPFNYADVTLSKLISAVEAMPDDSFDFFDETIQMNQSAARIGLSSRLGMAVGANYQDLIDKKVLADDSALYAKVLTAAAADCPYVRRKHPGYECRGERQSRINSDPARIGGRERMNVARARLLRALAISTLTTIYIKSYTGSLSALCGCAVAAATGASAAIVWMLGGTRDQIDATIKNMIANLTGMICDEER